MQIKTSVKCRGRATRHADLVGYEHNWQIGYAVLTTADWVCKAHDWQIWVGNEDNWQIGKATITTADWVGNAHN